MQRLRLAALALAGLCGCFTPSTTLHLPPRYSLVFLETGPATGLSPEEIQRISAGHRANIQRLGADGVLLLAGPFAEPRSDPVLRGIFVFDAGVEESRARTETDPAVQAGVFTMSIVPWRTAAPLRRVRQLEQGREQRGEDFAGRVYVLGTGAPLEAAYRAVGGLAAEGRVPFHGELGGERQGELLFALLAETPDEARALLEAAPTGTEVDWRLSTWYATEYLTELCSAPMAGAGAR